MLSSQQKSQEKNREKKLLSRKKIDVEKKIDVKKIEIKHEICMALMGLRTNRNQF